MNPLNRSDRIRMVRERHADLVRWAQLSRDVIQKLHRNGFKFEDLDDLSSIPELNLRSVSQLRKSSVDIPKDYRKDKEGFCTLILKIFAQKIDDIYDGDFLLGRDTQVATQNLFVLRILTNDHLAAARIDIAIEGNLAVIQLVYVAYTGPIGPNQTLGGFGDVGVKILRRERSIVAAGVSQDAPGLKVVLREIVPAIFGGGVVGIGASVLLDFTTGISFFSSMFFTIPVGVIAAYLFLVSGPLLRNRKGVRREVEQFDSVSLSPSLNWYSDYNQDADHRIFSGQVVGAVDEITAKLDALLRDASDPQK